jgi:GMP synthase (glutamine-hydrolysing)
MNRETVLIIDFGSQYTQLITRRIREANVYSEIHPHTITAAAVKKLEPKGIILSGGPMSVYDEGAPAIDPEILRMGIPVLGICYGLQFICKVSGGNVEQAKDREYGKAELKITRDHYCWKMLRIILLFG